MRQEDAVLLQRCFSRLSVNDREIIQLIDYDEVGYEQAAEALEITSEAARQRHSRAIARLRDFLEKERS